MTETIDPADYKRQLGRADVLLAEFERANGTKARSAAEVDRWVAGLAPEQQAAVCQKMNGAAAIKGPGHSTPATPRRALSVLIVDDNRDAADTLALLLRLHGHDARAAYGSEQATAMLGGWHADAAVLDIQMNGVDGIELAGRLRAGTNGSIVLVALTGLGTSHDVARVKAGPFDHCFLKPVEPEQLMGVLAALVGRTRPGAGC